MLIRSEMNDSLLHKKIEAEVWLKILFLETNYKYQRKTELKLLNDFLEGTTITQLWKIAISKEIPEDKRHDFLADQLIAYKKQWNVQWCVVIIEI